jgi:hypothetical protein
MDTHEVAGGALALFEVVQVANQFGLDLRVERHQHLDEPWVLRAFTPADGALIARASGRSVELAVPAFMEALSRVAGRLERS